MLMLMCNPPKIALAKLSLVYYTRNISLASLRETQRCDNMTNFIIIVRTLGVNTCTWDTPWIFFPFLFFLFFHSYFPRCINYFQVMSLTSCPCEHREHRYTECLCTHCLYNGVYLYLYYTLTLRFILISSNRSSDVCTCYGS